MSDDSYQESQKLRDCQENLALQRLQDPQVILVVQCVRKAQVDQVVEILDRREVLLTEQPQRSLLTQHRRVAYLLPKLRKMCTVSKQRRVFM